MWKVLDEGIVRVINRSSNPLTESVELIIPKEAFCEAYNKFCKQPTQQKKESNANKNRALSIAKSYIPKGNMDMYCKELCKGCVHSDCNEEQEACCFCQDGCFYEKRDMNF